MDKYIGFDIDCKKTVVCVVQKDKKDLYATIGPDIEIINRISCVRNAASEIAHTVRPSPPAPNLSRSTSCLFIKNVTTDTISLA